MGSSPSFNPFPGSGRVRCGALLPWLLALQPAARAAPGGCPGTPLLNTLPGWAGFRAL